MKVVIPPLKCQGIKTKLVPWIKNCIVWHQNQTGKWVEPFMGSGIVGFNIQPSQGLFCDTNPHLIQFYNAIKHQQITPAITRSFLESQGKELEKYGADYYYHVRDRFNQQGNPLDFLFLNRACFNGIIRFNRQGGFNVPFCHKPQRFSKSYITKIVNQVATIDHLIQQHQWEFKVQSYTDTLQGLQANDFVYCDPPYIDRHRDYFNCWDKKDEEYLYHLLSQLPCHFMLSTWHSNQYRQNEYIDQLWSKFLVMTKSHFYHVGAKEMNRNAMLEALIINYELELPETILEQQLSLLD